MYKKRKGWLALYPIVKSIVFNSEDNFELNPFNFMANDHHKMIYKCQRKEKRVKMEP